MKEKPDKLAIHVRVPRYEVGRSKKIAKRFDMKVSNYFNMILHDANDHFEKIEDFSWKTYLKR